MNNRGFDNSPRGYSNSPRGYSPYSLSNRRHGNGLNQTGYGPSAWGSPSPGPRTTSYPNRRPSVSPRHHQFSPRHHGLSDSFTPSNYRTYSPKEHHFKTPNTSFIPFSSPNSGGCRGRGSGRKYHKTFQNQWKDKSCNPGGSQNIEDYYHPEMLQDPWKFCSPVPVSKA